MGIDDVLRLGHLTLSVDQLSDRPKSRTSLLDYMAPEMLSVKPHNEHELALGLLDDSSSESGGKEEDEQSKQQQQPQQIGLQRASGGSKQGTAAIAARQRSSSGGGGSSSSGGQQPSRQGSRSIPVLQDEGSDATPIQQASGSSSSHLMRSSRSLNAAAAAGRAEWEHRWACVRAVLRVCVLQHSMAGVSTLGAPADEIQHCVAHSKIMLCGVLCVATDLAVQWPPHCCLICEVHFAG
jgi:hypothetical protein